MVFAVASHGVTNLGLNLCRASKFTPAHSPETHMFECFFNMTTTVASLTYP